MKSLGVLEALQRYPLQMKTLFVKTEQSLTASDLENLFHIVHSERGSNAFQGECRTLAFWQDYLQDAECKSGMEHNVYIRHYSLNCFDSIIVIHDIREKNEVF